MSTAAKHDPDAGYEPAFAAPKNACDAHFHVFGREEQYPYYALDLRYKPPYEPLEAYMKLARRLGFERFVFVQPSAYGFDNSCMLDAMAEVAPATAPRHRPSRRDEAERCGAGQVACAGRARRAHQRLAGAQARGGVRRSPAAQDRAHGGDLPRARLAPRLPAARLADQRADGERCASCRWSSRWRTWGSIRPRTAPKQPGFQEFLRLVGDGSKRCWVKLTGIYRFSQDPSLRRREAHRRGADGDRCRTS